MGNYMTLQKINKNTLRTLQDTTGEYRISEETKDINKKIEDIT